MSAATSGIHRGMGPGCRSRSSGLRSELPVTPEMPMPIVVAAAAPVAAIWNPEHALDRPHGAADAGTHGAADHTTHRAGDPVTFVGALPGAAHDALGVPGMGDRQQREEDGGGRKS